LFEIWQKILILSPETKCEIVLGFFGYVFSNPLIVEKQAFALTWFYTLFKVLSVLNGLLLTIEMLKAFMALVLVEVM